MLMIAVDVAVSFVPTPLEITDSGRNYQVRRVGRRLHFGLLGVVRHHGHVVSQVETQMELERAVVKARAFGVGAVFVPADNQDVHVTWGRLLAERRRRGKSD